MKKLNNFIYFVITLFFLTYANLYCSNIISQRVHDGWNYSNHLFKIIYIENTGAAFSIMQDSTIFLIIISIVAMIGIIYFLIKNFESFSMKSLLFTSFLCAGILGNLYERICLGHVRDFFDLNFTNFPIFNISDIFINIGVLGIIILILLTKKNIKLS